MARKDVYRHDIIREVLAQRVLGIVRTHDAASAIAASRTMLDAGLTAVEIPLTNRGALDAIADLTAAYPTAVIGAGTVLDEPSAVAAIRAGATFLVAPNLEPSVIRAAHRYGAAAIPGCATVTEIVRALEEGADAVKVFPATAIAPGWVSDVRAAVPQAPIVVTGGIQPEGVLPWLKAGAAACGLGSKLTSGSAEEAGRRISGLLGELAGLADH